MSLKLTILVIVLIAVGAWFFLWGPEGCRMLEDTRYGELPVQIEKWVTANIDASWLDGTGSIASVEVSDLKIKQVTKTETPNEEIADVVIKGSYRSRNSGKELKFKIDKQIKVVAINGQSTFKLLN